MKGAPNQFEQRLVELIVDEAELRDSKKLKRALEEIDNFKSTLSDLKSQLDEYKNTVDEVIETTPFDVPEFNPFLYQCGTCSHFCYDTKIGLDCWGCSKDLPCVEWCVKALSEPEAYACACGRRLCGQCSFCVMCKFTQSQ
jgi:hypothetical protein